MRYAVVCAVNTYSGPDHRVKQYWDVYFSIVVPTDTCEGFYFEADTSYKLMCLNTISNFYEASCIVSPRQVLFSTSFVLLRER